MVAIARYGSCALNTLVNTHGPVFRFGSDINMLQIAEARLVARFGDHASSLGILMCPDQRRERRQSRGDYPGSARPQQIFHC
jgi:hypothetical protein